MNPLKVLPSYTIYLLLFIWMQHCQPKLYSYVSAMSRGSTNVRISCYFFLHTDTEYTHTGFSEYRNSLISLKNGSWWSKPLLQAKSEEKKKQRLTYYSQKSLFPTGARYVSLLQCPDQLRGQPSVLSSGYMSSLPGGKAARTWSWQLTYHLVLSSRMMELYLHCHMSSWCSAYLIKHRTNWT